jgi:hypothetical protein
VMNSLTISLRIWSSLKLRRRIAPSNHFGPLMSPLVARR